MYKLRYYKQRERGEPETARVYHASTPQSIHEWVSKNIPVNETGVLAIFRGDELIGIYQPIGGILTVPDYKSLPDNHEYPWKLYKYCGENELGNKLSFVRAFPHFEDVQVWLNLERSYQPRIRGEVFSVYADRQFIAQMRCERYFKAFFPAV